MAPCSLNLNRQEAEKVLLRSEKRTVAMVKKGARENTEGEGKRGLVCKRREGAE
jgi:hypothetical protein